MDGGYWIAVYAGVSGSSTVSMFLTDCMVPLALELGAPYAFISPADVFPLVSTAFGNRLSPSFVPFPVFPFTDRMTFLQRFVNVLGTTVLDFFMSWSLDALVDQVNLAEYGPGTPTVAELRRNASLLILNTVPGMELAKPIMPGVVQAGGMHCKPSKPLPKELEDWVSGSSNGFIYFSLGSAVQGKMMPEKFRKMFVEAFARFPQYRILWKWETEVMDDLPKHVKLSKWLPQQDLLGTQGDTFYMKPAVLLLVPHVLYEGHKDIKLFITHGGLLSTQEATYHGVPVVGIPIGADQMLNMKRTENEGAGLTLEWSSLTTEGIYNAVLRVLSEPSFRENLKRRSAIMRDQPQTPLDRAVYWTEYVIRHKGAAHLRSAARDLTWWQYHLLDVWLFVGAVLLGFLLVAYFVTRCFLRCLGRKLFGVPAAMGDKKRQ
ncbi:unnamed protein product [Notodromas monacha]|uniref:UDP-glucuronosyltransferase n=1 Tax=Notodromas monacha TaxID=399045 RepID=A0A7R9C1B1_9CRUS|nr:unnamed protein product [Notodromas monacha]CAG0924203.1 unnamed protein product [Notodromas monacha]